MRSERAALARLLLGALAGVSGCASLGTLGAAGGVGEAGGRYDRVLVPRFADIYAVAISPRSVYLATDGGIGVYDRLQRAWLPPVTGADGQPLGRVAALAADPSADGVWIGGTGMVWLYEPALGLWTRAVVPGRVDRIAFDARDASGGALVHAGGTWSRVSSNGAVSPLMPNEGRAGALAAPAGLPELLREYPSLEAMAPMLTRDASQHSWRILSGTRAPDRTSDVWLGTFGGGAFEVDPNFAQSTQQPVGLLGAGAAALARTADGIWVAPLGEAAGVPGESVSRAALTLASEDLRRWRWADLSGGAPGLLGVRVTRMLVRGNTVWLGTDRGVVVASLNATAPPRIVGAVDGIPSDYVLAIAAWRGSILVGTSRGTALLDSATARPVGSAGADVAPVRALLTYGDTAWIGTDAGLYLAAGAAPPRRVTARPVRALARADSLLVFATAGELFRLAADGHASPLYPTVDFHAVGTIAALTADGRSIVAGGPFGDVVVARATGASRYDRSAGDTYDALFTDAYLWLATRDGLLRVRRQGDLVP